MSSITPQSSLDRIMMTSTPFRPSSMFYTASLASVMRIFAPQQTRTLHENILRVFDNWSDDLFDFARRDLPRILAIMIVTLVLWRILRVITRRIERLSHSGVVAGAMRAQQLRTVSSVAYSVGVAVLAFLAVMQSLLVLNIKIEPLLASAGIAGLAVGFGAQTLVRDVINGFFILLENWFDVGDTVKIGAVQGAVESLSLRRVTLRDADGSVHIVPNSQINIASNLTRDWTQVALHISVDYKENSDRVLELLKQIGAEIHADPKFQQSLVSEPQVPGIDRVTGDVVDYLMLVKTRPGQQFAISRELRRRIKQCFEQNGIKPGGQNPLYVTQ
ncbi:MAG TPA: mechanosensitive ion channel family protein [Candidatus Acidoferrales bacterium]|nr:mechanosensitive ion channel family protein [Candidatus Acidoferrales bacterium]